MDKIITLLRRHEGFRSKPYKDSVGKLTIGFGRNLDDIGISEKEAEILLINDIRVAELELDKILDTSILSENRYNALVNLMFNIGTNRFLTFRKMIKAVKDHNFRLAAIELLDSKYHRQVKNRAEELAILLENIGG
jgi:lysozyme